MKYYYCPRCKEKYAQNNIRLMCPKCGYEIAARAFEKNIEPRVYRYYKKAVTNDSTPLISPKFIKIISIAAVSVMIITGAFFAGRYFIIKNKNANLVAKTSENTTTELEVSSEEVTKEENLKKTTAKEAKKETAKETAKETKKEAKKETIKETAKETKKETEKTIEKTDSTETEVTEKKSILKKPAFIGKIGTFASGVGVKVKNLFTKEELGPNTKASSLSDKECKVGTIGEGGGVIFYDKMEYSDGWRYLEVAMDDIGPMSWGKIKVDKTFGRGGFGLGDKYTYRAISFFGTKNPAYAAASYGNTEDWYLSSDKEIEVLFAVIKDNYKKNLDYSWKTKRKITKARKYFKKRIGGIEEFVFPKENYYWALPAVFFYDFNNSSTVWMYFYDSNANKLETKYEKVNGTEYIGNDEYFVRPIRKY